MTPAPPVTGRMGRIIASLMIVIGIATMHHLVVSGCSALADGPSTPHGVAEAANDDAGAYGESGGGSHHDSSSPSGDVDLGDVCAGLITALWLLIPLVRSWWIRRHDIAGGFPRLTDTRESAFRPPDRDLLSISRT